MKREVAGALRKEAVPVLRARLTEPELARLFPVSFEGLDPWSMPEPSKGALIRLKSGRLAVVTYGTMSHTLELSLPKGSDAGRGIEDILSEVPIKPEAIQWRKDRLTVPQSLSTANPGTPMGQWMMAFRSDARVEITDARVKILDPHGRRADVRFDTKTHQFVAQIKENVLKKILGGDDPQRGLGHSESRIVVKTTNRHEEKTLRVKDVLHVIRDPATGRLVVQTTKLAQEKQVNSYGVLRVTREPDTGQIVFQATNPNEGKMSHPPPPHLIREKVGGVFKRVKHK